MSLGHGASIVRDGLVLHLDAANVKSYPGSGTVWNDISKDKYTSTLYNGPIYSGVNGGSISVDAANDFIELNQQALNFQPTDPFSVFVFMESPPYVSGGAIVSNMQASSPFYGYDLWINTATIVAAHLISGWSANAIKVGVTYDWNANSGKKVYMGYTYDGSSPTTVQGELNSFDFYINGKLEETGKTRPSTTGQFNSSSETISYPSAQRFRIGSRFSSGTKAVGTQIKMYSVQVYNKKLTAAEIRQNFEATRGRYGI